MLHLAAGKSLKSQFSMGNWTHSLFWRYCLREVRSTCTLLFQQSSGVCPAMWWYWMGWLLLLLWLLLFFGSITNNPKLSNSTNTQLLYPCFCTWTLWAQHIWVPCFRACYVVIYVLSRSVFTSEASLWDESLSIPLLLLVEFVYCGCITLSN